MVNLTTVAYAFLAAGILTSVSLIGIHQALLFIPALFFTFKAYQKKELHISKSNAFLFLFLIWAFISLCFNFDILDNSLKSFGKLKFIFLALSGIPVLYYWLIEVKPRVLKILTNLFLLSIIVAGLVAIVQVIIAGGGRSEGLIGIMRYGYASAMISVVLLGVILQRDKLNFEFNLKLASVALVFGVVGMFLTQTRGALAGFMSAIPFVLYFYKPKIGIAFGIVSAALISIIAYAYLFGSGNYGSRYLKSRNELGDVVRREQWQSAIIATKESPFLGVGYNNFYSQVERIKKENHLKTTFYINEHSHNTFLEIAAGTGLIGVGLFVLWLFLWALECFNLNSALRGVFIPFGVCVIASGQFEVILDSNNAVLLFFVYTLSQCALIMQKQKGVN